MSTDASGKEIINLQLNWSDLLLPCPFCGYEEIELCNTWTACYWLECQGCFAQVSDNERVDRDPFNKDAHEASKRAAIAAWNRRT